MVGDMGDGITHQLGDNVHCTVAMKQMEEKETSFKNELFPRLQMEKSI